MYQAFDSVLLPRSITGGLIDIGAYEYSVATGMEENQLRRDISVYPNPTKDFIHIILPDLQRSSVAIYSLLGQQVFIATNPNVIDISNFAEGIYSLTVKQDATIWRTKIVKQKYPALKTYSHRL